MKYILILLIALSISCNPTALCDYKSQQEVGYWYIIDIYVNSGTYLSSEPGFNFPYKVDDTYNYLPGFEDDLNNWLTSGVAFLEVIRPERRFEIDVMSTEIVFDSIVMQNNTIQTQKTYPFELLNCE